MAKKKSKPKRSKNPNSQLSQKQHNAKIMDVYTRAFDTPRPHLFMLSELNSVFYPKLTKICAAEHDRLISSEVNPISPECYCRYFGGDAFEYIKKETSKTNESEFSFYDIFRQALAICVWQQSKTVYRFDDELYKECLKMDFQDVIKTPASILKSIPEWGFYIETPQHDSLEGILYASVEDYMPEESTSTYQNVIIIGLHKDCENYSYTQLYSTEINPLAMVLGIDHENETIGDSLILDMMVKQAYKTKEAASALAAQELTAVAIPLLAYLCTINVDAPVEIRRPRTIKKRSVKVTESVKQQNVIVGERVGAAIRAKKIKYISENSSVSGEKAHTKEPHMRKAHIKHYWVGPRKDGQKGDHLEARWIPPVFVNADKVKDIAERPVTTRRVVAEKSKNNNG